MQTPTLEQLEARIRKLEAHSQNEQQQTILRKIADGKLLMRFSYMTHNVTCDCCKAEEKLEIHHQPDHMQHKSWCLVTAVRQLLPDFTPSNYPADLRQLRNYSDQACDKPEFVWIAQYQPPEEP